MSMVDEVTKALGVPAGPVTARDGGTVELALTYALEIDAGGDIAKLGPPLLSCLAQLMLTPAARAAALRTGKQPDKDGTSPLDELRRKRAERAAGA